MRTSGSAIANSTGGECRKKSVPGSRYCIFHVDRGPILLAGVVGAVLSLFVSEVYRSAVPSAETQLLVAARRETSDLKKSFTERQERLSVQVDALLKGNE